MVFLVSGSILIYRVEMIIYDAEINHNTKNQIENLFLKKQRWIKYIKTSKDQIGQKGYRQKQRFYKTPNSAILCNFSFFFLTNHYRSGFQIPPFRIKTLQQTPFNPINGSSSCMRHQPKHLRQTFLRT